MPTFQERQKKRAANHEARVADSKKSLVQKASNFFTRRKNASASAPANKRMTTYKVFKGYTPKNKRSLPWLGNNRNIVWDLAVNEPNDGVVNKAKARYLKLLKGFANLKDKTEFYTLYQLLKDKNLFGNIKEGPTGGTAHNYYNEIQYKAPTPAASPSSAPAAAPSPSAAPAAAPSNSDNPTPLVHGNASGRSNASDPTTNIDKTIAQMRCTVCKSQKIISGALGTTPRPCNNCGSTNLNAAAAASPELEKKAREQITNYTKASNFISQYEELSAEEKTHLNAINHVKYSVAKKMINSRPLQAAPAPAATPAVAASSAAASPAAAAPAPAPAASNEFENVPNTTLPPGWKKRKNKNNVWYVNPDGKGTWNRPLPSSGGRRSRRRHRKTSRRTKNKRSTRRR